MANRSIGCALLGPGTLAVALAGLFVVEPASAQVLGNAGDAVFGAERLFGVRYERQWIEPNDTQKGTTLSFGTSETLLPHNRARLGFDYLAARKFSIGGALGFSSTSADGAPTERTFLFVGRFGFLHMFGNVLGFWPRGGLVYRSTSIENGSDSSDFGFTLELMFPIAIAPHFGILTGPSFDQSFTGNHDPGAGADRDLDIRSIGWQVGLFGWI